MSSAPDSSSAPDLSDNEKLSEREHRLIRWEEWALSIEEHYHALELFKRNPTGLPMGHR